jgi:hypothetical protein
MITGTHIVLFSDDAEADRGFIRDVLGFRWVDAGHGWLIFQLPPSEVAVHPLDVSAGASGGEGDLRAGFYLMCDDVSSYVDSLRAEGVDCSSITEAGWGLLTSVTLPSGGRLGLYQPLHPTAIDVE